jgi:hypothetical protein
MSVGNSPSEIYQRFYSLVRQVEMMSPLLTNLGLSISLQSKFYSLELMQIETKKRVEQTFATYKSDKAKQDHIVLKELGKNLNESIAYFEAYLNAFYSLFQIIAKVTPYFFNDEKLRKNVLHGEFAKETEIFHNCPILDPDYANYLETMTWYRELMYNRHAVTHNAAVFLAFDKEHIVFIDMPKKRIDFFEQGKPNEKLIDYMEKNWSSLFEYLDFYEKHFRDFKIIADQLEELEFIKKATTK